MLPDPEDFRSFLQRTKETEKEQPARRLSFNRSNGSHRKSVDKSAERKDSAASH